GNAVAARVAAHGPPDGGRGRARAGGIGYQYARSANAPPSVAAAGRRLPAEQSDARLDARNPFREHPWRGTPPAISVVTTSAPETVKRLGPPGGGDRAELQRGIDSAAMTTTREPGGEHLLACYHATPASARACSLEKRALGDVAGMRGY